MNHFERLNLPVQFVLPPEDLDRQYFGFQRTFHPDRFSGKSARERAIAMEHATSVNEAYQTLKTVLGRAEHLLEVRGHEIPGKDGGTIDDPTLLMEIMEMREVVAEASGEAEITAAADSVAAQLDQAESALEDAFSRDRVDLALQHTLRLRYLSKLADEVKQRGLALSQPKPSGSKE